MRFQDMMDEGRVVEVVSQQGKTFDCKVFWKAAGGALTYGGRVTIPAALFDAKRRDVERVGFIPLAEILKRQAAQRAIEAERAARTARFANRRQNDEE